MSRRPRTVLIEDIPVRVRKSRTRSLRLTIHGGEVRLSLPHFVSYRRGIDFLKEKEAWVVEKLKEHTSLPVSFLRQGSQSEFKMLRSETLRIIEDSVRKYAPGYKVFPKRISIRNQKTRWGSCSRTGTLSFSYRLVLLPERLRDYIIVHELCHLAEFSHSRSFWSLVGRSFPDYREIRRELRHFQLANS